MKDKKKILNIYPVTAMQEGMIYHIIKDNKSGVYVEQTVLQIEGLVNASWVEESFNKIIEKHDIFRMAFVYNKMDKPKQVLLRERKISVDYHDFSDLNEKDKSAAIDHFLEKDKKTGFDIEKETLIRINLIKKDSNHIELIMTFSHLIMDGWCISLLLKDFVYYYEKMTQGKSIDDSSEYSYVEYIKWLNNQDKESSLEEWKRYLSGFEESTSLKGKTPVNNEQYDYTARNVRIDKKTRELIDNYSRRNGITTCAFFQTVWGILLQKYNNTNESVFGTVVSGRSAGVANIEQMMGMFINTLPFRVSTEDKQTFSELAKKSQDLFNDVRQFEYTPLADIQSVTEGKGNLITSLFVFENYPMNELLNSLQSNNTLGFTINDVYSIEQTNYDFNITINPHKGYEIEFKYNGNVFNEDDIDIICDIFQRLIKEVLSDKKMEDYNLISENMEERIALSLNHKDSHYPKEKCISQIFEEVAVKYPERVAVEFKEEFITYRELDEKSSRMALKLREMGVKNNDIVAVLVEPSIDIAISILAVVKAGGAYMPIDTFYPIQRQRYMLEDSRAQYLISRNAYMEDLSWNNNTLLLEELNNIEKIAPVNINCINNLDDRAYIIYTSGSTGNPKGTVITHQNVIRLLFNDKFQFDFSERDIWTNVHSFCFDVSVWEFYGALLYGGKLIILEREEKISPEKISNIIKDKHVTVLNHTPIAFYGIMDICEKKGYKNLSLRYVIFSGDVLTPVKLKNWKKSNPNCHLINMYGTTETTVHITFKELNEQDLETNLCNIGRPLPTLSVSIRDKNHCSLPMNLPGEICIEGDGLAEGYLFRDELTNKKFITDLNGNRVYCSGDLGRILSNGDLEYLGRMDEQIKIRGFRIEPGEIEERLRELDEIKDAYVLAKKEENAKTLCAYIIFKQKLSLIELRERLSEILPYYMIPSYFVEINEVPYTNNRKLDRKKLLTMENYMTSSNNQMKASSKNEEIMIDIWKSILKFEKIGRNDNFFECGGDSIKAIQVVSRLRRFKKSLEIKYVMQYPMLEDMCRYIKEDIASDEKVSGECKLSPIQKKYINNNDSLNHFNQALILKLNQTITDEVITQMFTKLVEHHDTLRLRVTNENGTFIQKYIDLDEECFMYRSFTLDESLDEDDFIGKMEELQTIYHKKIDLSNQIMAVIHFKKGNENYISIIIHHMYVDGISWRILVDDLNIIFQQIVNNEDIELPTKTTSYKKWVEKLIDYTNSIKCIQDINYWNEITKNQIENDRYDNCERDMVKLKGYLSYKETEELLKTICYKYNTGMDVLLLSSLGSTLHKIRGEKEFLVDIESHGRQDMFEGLDISRTMGWFAYTYPVLLNITENNNWSKVIREVKEALNRVPKKGFDYLLLRELSNEEDICFRDFVPKYSFNYMGEMDNENGSDIEITNLPVGVAVGEKNVTKYQFEIDSFVREGCLEISIRFNKNNFSVEEVQPVIDTYLDEIREIITSGAEKSRILSPSDMSYDDMTINEFDELLKDIILE